MTANLFGEASRHQDAVGSPRSSNASAHNTLKPQPGQMDDYQPQFHPLPGPYAQRQLEGGGRAAEVRSAETGQSSDLSKALSAESQQHARWEKYQGVTPGISSYKDPRAFQNVLLPTDQYGTVGR